MAEFSGLVAVVTGGASGIGAAIVAELTERGCRVALFDRELADAPEDGIAVVVDVGDARMVCSAIDVTAEQLGGIDIVVNCAGLSATGNVAANEDDEWHRVLDVNVVGVARVTRAALPWLRRSAHAVVVNVTSAVVHVGVKDRALYTASKGAVAAMTVAMAADHVKEGIRINAVAPGTAETPWVARLLADESDPDSAADALRARQPLGRLIAAEEIAHAVASLASPRAASTTGVTLSVDGGMSSLRV